MDRNRSVAGLDTIAQVDLLILGVDHVGPHHRLLGEHGVRGGKSKDFGTFRLLDRTVLDPSDRYFSRPDHVVGEDYAAVDFLRCDQHRHALAAGGIELETTLIKHEKNHSESGDDGGDCKGPAIHGWGTLSQGGTA